MRLIVQIALPDHPKHLLLSLVGAVGIRHFALYIEPCRLLSIFIIAQVADRNFFAGDTKMQHDCILKDTVQADDWQFPQKA